MYEFEKACEARKRRKKFEPLLSILLSTFYLILATMKLSLLILFVLYLFKWLKLHW